MTFAKLGDGRAGPRWPARSTWPTRRPSAGRSSRHLTGAGAVLIDLTAVSFLDSAGVRLLDALVGDLDDHGTPIRLVVGETRRRPDDPAAVRVPRGSAGHRPGHRPRTTWAADSRTAGASTLKPMSVSSVFPQLEQLLPRVSKPIQYVGGELGAVVKDWDAATVRWALMYPDAYEVGLPNQGVQILYEVLNEQPDVLAERTYAVWPDLEALMQRARRPAVHRRRAPPGAGVRRVRASRSPPSSATPTCSPRSTWPASRC